MAPTVRLTVTGASMLATLLAGALGLFAAVGGGDQGSCNLEAERFSGVHRYDPAARLEHVEEDTGGEDEERALHLSASLADGCRTDAVARQRPQPARRVATGTPRHEPPVRGPPSRC